MEQRLLCCAEAAGGWEGCSSACVVVCRPPPRAAAGAWSPASIVSLSPGVRGGNAVVCAPVERIVTPGLSWAVTGVIAPRPTCPLPSRLPSLAGGSPHPVHLAGFPWPPSLSAVSICCAPGPRLLLFHPIPSVVGKPGVRICAPGLLLKPCLSSCLLHRGPLKIY